MENKCKYCKYFGDEILVDIFDDAKYNDIYDHPSGYHTCDRIKNCPSSKIIEMKEKAIIVDGSGFYTALRVTESFYCAEFERK